MFSDCTTSIRNVVVRWREVFASRLTVMQDMGVGVLLEVVKTSQREVVDGSYSNVIRLVVTLGIMV